MSAWDTLKSLVTFSDAELSPATLQALPPAESYAAVANQMPTLVPLAIGSVFANLLRSICHVLFVCAEEQMARIAALRVVAIGAIVTNLHAFWDRPVEQLPRDTVGTERPLLAIDSVPELSVAIRSKRSGPKPTSVVTAGTINVPFESLFQRDRLKPATAKRDAILRAESTGFGASVDSEQGERFAAVLARACDLRSGPCRIALARLTSRQARFGTKPNAATLRHKLGSAHGARSEGILRGHDRLRSVVPYPRLVAQRGGFSLASIIPREAAKWA